VHHALGTDQRFAVESRRLIITSEEIDFFIIIFKVNNNKYHPVNHSTCLYILDINYVYHEEDNNSI